jgi:hypothetical protein
MAQYIIDRAKKEAKRIHKDAADSVTLRQAQDRAAQDLGYRDWADLLRMNG